MRTVLVAAVCAVLGPGAPGMVQAAEAPPSPATTSPATASPATPSPAPSASPAPAETAAPVATASAATPYAGLPKVVAKAVKELEAACRAGGGTPGWQLKTVFEAVDLSPDGRPDYLIDTHAMACDDGIPPWMGSDGFRYILFVSTAPHRWTRAFDRPARIFEIVPAKDGAPARVEVFSHYAHCALPNPDRYMRCNQTYEWRGGRLRKVSEDWETN